MLIKVLLSLALLIPFFPTLAKPTEGAWAAEHIFSQDNCEQILQPIVNGDISLEQLTNPILTTQTEIKEQVDLFTEMHQCLDEGTASQIDDRERIRTLLEYFLIFAGGLDTPTAETTLDLELLEISSDPGVVNIRDEAGIEAPEGYIFVRSYTSREAMPPLLRRAFEGPDVAGVTILSRYIAVIAEDKKTWPQRALQLQTLPETTSHELIHAYVNSTLVPLNFNLPTWFSEGLAIYFSGSEKIHKVVTPNFTIRNSSTEDYQLYDTAFRYLEARHGPERLLELINRSIEGADPSALYQDLGIGDDQQLLTQAGAWSRQRNNLARGGIVVVALIAVLLLWRLAPEYNCQNCGHTGRKRDLIDEIYCPNCKRPYERAVPW
jgi:hypothetical protein